MKIWQLTLYGNQGYTVFADSIEKAIEVAKNHKEFDINTDKVHMIKQVPYHPYRLREEDMTDDKTEFPNRLEVSG